MCYLFYSVYTYCVSQYLYVDGVCKMFNTVFGNVDTMLAVVNGTRGLTEKGDCYAGETGIDSSSEIRKLKKKNYYCNHYIYYYFFRFFFLFFFDVYFFFYLFKYKS